MSVKAAYYTGFNVALRLFKVGASISPLAKTNPAPISKLPAAAAGMAAAQTRAPGMRPNTGVVQPGTNPIQPIKPGA